MAKRSYQTDQIRVHWNSDRCIHTGICLRSLPEVFNNELRPWVDVDAATADQIAQTIERCPSGALTYERLDDSAGEQPPQKTTIIPWPNGPLFVRGQVEVRDSQGDVFAAGTRMTLCRCGNSQNQPFCDLSHRRARFRDAPRAVSAAREEARSPHEISPTPGP